jgi:long-chain fatty acid transport protein
MKRFQVSKLALIISMMSCSSLTYAAAFQFYELGTPVIGTAGVGQAANANDASTAYFNPAGMSALATSQVMLGGQFILPYTNFSPNTSNTITGNNGGTASLLAPGFDSYYVYRATPKLGLGVSLTSPYGGAYSYNDHWVGRYIVQQMTFYTIDLNPVVSYQLNSWLSLGAGIVFEYANLNQNFALPIAPTVDGQADINVDNLNTGFNLGVLVTPDSATKVGVAYRSQIVHHLHGNSDFLNIASTPATQSRMTMPANIIVSMTRMLSDKFTLLGEAGWSDWSSMRNTIVTVDGFTEVTPLNWNSTYRVGLGGRYQFRPALLLQAGVSYDSSPTNTNQRLPSLPVDRQIRFGAGLEYALIKAVTLATSYEYMNLGKAHINNTTALGTLSGSYPRNYANVFQISLNVSC